MFWFKTIATKLIWFGVYYALAHFFGHSPLFLAILIVFVSWSLERGQKNEQKIIELHERIDQIQELRHEQIEKDNLRFKRLYDRLNQEH